MVFVFLCPGTPEGSTGSGFGFKASQKAGPRHKSHPTDWEKPGIIFVAEFLGCTITGWVGLWFCGSMSRSIRRLNRQWF